MNKRFKGGLALNCCRVEFPAHRQMQACGMPSGTPVHLFILVNFEVAFSYRFFGVSRQSLDAGVAAKRRVAV